MPRPKLLLVGHLTHDRYADTVRPGGGAYYCAEVYRRLGTNLHVATLVGEDFQHPDVLARTPTTVTRRGWTTTFVNLYPAGRPRIQLVSAVAPPVESTGIPDQLRAADVVHLAPVFGEIDIVSWKRAVRPGRLAISVQGWVRQAGPLVAPLALAPLVGADVAAWATGNRVLPRPWDIDVESLRGVDIAFLSTEDLVGQGDLLDRLRQAIPLVVVTHGAQGCSMYGHGRVTRIGVFATHEVDATGAGDIFAAGMLWALATGAHERAAARFGAAAASLVIEAVGTEALEHLDQAASRATQVPVLSEEPLPTP
ncbi:MAG TPA: PfkB family carbohydrate kinase [Haliangium sp.]|nr:PfkB family carbohydrate kinase [Haliangium sp.]